MNIYFFVSVNYSVIIFQLLNNNNNKNIYILFYVLVFFLYNIFFAIQISLNIMKAIRF